MVEMRVAALLRAVPARVDNLDKLWYQPALQRLLLHALAQRPYPGRARQVGSVRRALPSTPAQRFTTVIKDREVRRSPAHPFTQHSGSSIEPLGRKLA